jgi:hypothetical protein
MLTHLLKWKVTVRFYVLKAVVMEYKAMQSVEVNWYFGNMSPLSSESKDKPSNKPSWSRREKKPSRAEPSRAGGDKSPRTISWLSGTVQHYIAEHGNFLRRECSMWMSAVIIILIWFQMVACTLKRTPIWIRLRHTVVSNALPNHS